MRASNLSHWQHNDNVGIHLNIAAMLPNRWGPLLSAMTKRISTLLVCGEPPFPPYNGMRIPTWNMARYFPQNWELSLYCATGNSLECIEQLEHELAKIRSVCVFRGTAWKARQGNKFLSILYKLFRFVFSIKPSFSIGHPSREISEDLGKLFSSNVFDVVIFDAEYLAAYVSEIPQSCFKVISPNDSITLAWKNELKYQIFKNPFIKIYKRENIRRAYRFEKEKYRQFELCHFVSQIDANFVAQFVPQEKIVAIPNGVEPAISDPSIAPSRNSNKAIIVGALVGGNYRYTIRFIREVWTKVIERNPSLELTIVSRVCPKSFKKNVGRYNIKIIDYAGDLSTYFQNFGIVISPVLKDCGVLNKVLEGMASRRAVIGYECGFRGIPEAKHLNQVLSATNPTEMIELILSASSLRIDLDSIGLRAQELVSEKYVWKDKILRLADLIEQQIESASENCQ